MGPGNLERRAYPRAGGKAWAGLGGKHASGRLTVTYRLWRRISRI